MKIPFAKMHGLGNDFILIDCREFNPGDISTLARRLCHRRLGIGADQLLLLYPSGIADFKMLIVNSDGSEVEMCGNGIRCFAKFVWERGLSDKKSILIETLAGIIKPEKSDGLIRVDMGEPTLDPPMIPVVIPDYETGKDDQSGGKMVIDYPLLIDDSLFKITCISMGNPHVVIVVDNVSTFPVAYYGPMIENHHFFPRRTNVEFIEIVNANEIKMRVWERGSGETMACGTGASAVAVASSLKGLSGRSVAVHLTGGDLFIDWAADNHVYMTGPAVEAYTGQIELE